MDISFCTNDDVGQQTGCVVVIDVLRAFTTAAVALSAGAGPYHLVGTLQQAYACREQDPTTRLLGEVDGVTAPGFDFGNSPTQLLGTDLRGIPIAHRSSAGTQGVVRASSASRVLVASFAVAGATAQALSREPRISFCITGLHSGRDGEEDRACGDYLATLLRQGDGCVDPPFVDPPFVEPGPFLDRVAASTAAGLFQTGHPDLPAEDVPFAQVLDRYDFAMQVDSSGGRHRLTSLTT